MNENHTNSDNDRNGGDCPSNIDSGIAVFVDDFLEYSLGKSGYQWRRPATRAAGDRTIAAQVGIALRNLADEFVAQYKDQFVEMIQKLEFSAHTLKDVIDGVANELFCEGVKWARIVAFFVFGSEIAMICKNRDLPNLIDSVAICLTSYIQEKLMPWINDHGGWDGLINFNEGEENGQAKNKWPSVKNLLCIGISAIGAITLGAVLTKS